ncbi:CHAT domain-containing protein [Corallococcus sp. CA047B]|nr:CHAT domain-containing protein [Corallococcus sp. CA047B]
MGVPGAEPGWRSAVGGAPGATAHRAHPPARGERRLPVVARLHRPRGGPPRAAPPGPGGGLSGPTQTGGPPVRHRLEADGCRPRRGTLGAMVAGGLRGRVLGGLLRHGRGAGPGRVRTAPGRGDGRAARSLPRRRRPTAPDGADRRTAGPVRRAGEPERAGSTGPGRGRGARGRGSAPRGHGGQSLAGGAARLRRVVDGAAGLRCPALRAALARHPHAVRCHGAPKDGRRRARGVGPDRSDAPHGRRVRARRARGHGEATDWRETAPGAARWREASGCALERGWASGRPARHGPGATRGGGPGGGMRAVITVVREPSLDPAAFWRVEVDGTPHHHLRRLDNGFPFPTEDGALDGLPEVTALWQGMKPEKGLRGAFTSIHGGTPTQGHLWGFGRYLLETLLGGVFWQQLKGRCPKNESLELVLEWDSGEWELSRLHWELMRDDTGFLAEQHAPEVSLVRRVPVTRPFQARAPIDLRVLFVVGTDLTDPRIRPGAEYLGLLRHLNHQQRALHHRVLIAAHGEDLAAAVKSYQPTVLHLTCHGEWDSIHLKPGREAPPSEEREGFKRWSAQDLYQLLQGTGVPLPTVVVVNACDSAKGRPPMPQEDPASATAQASFAVELAKLGVPMVVGMAGEVADHACRLFTRRLYESLLEGVPNTPVDLGLATTTGRRAGLQLLDGRHATSDWAFSQLIIRGDTDTRLVLKDVGQASVRLRIANTLRVNHPFCDRLEAFRDFERWLDSGRCEWNPFAIVGPAMEQPPVKYGATRLMSELAVHALQSGYVPVLFGFPEGSTEAPTTERLLTELFKKLRDLRNDWGVGPAKDSQLRALLLREKSPAPPLHPDLDEALTLGGPTDPAVLRLALAMDLAALAKDTQCKGALLLLDGIHTWSPALSTLVHLLEHRLIFEGLTTPVVVSCRRWPGHPQADGPIKALLERATVERHDISRFPEALEPLIYNQYVLLREPPQVPNPAMPNVAMFLETYFKDLVKGLPSQLHGNAGLDAVLKALGTSKMLLQADDQATMKALLRGTPAREGQTS